MIAYPGGRTLTGHIWTTYDQITVSGTDVASITFSNVQNSEIFVIDLYWVNPAALLDRLDLVINAQPTPAGSVMIRTQTGAVGGIREDRQDPDFTLTDLVGGVASSFSKVLCYFSGFPTDSGMRYAQVCGINTDSALVLGDRIRAFTRQGQWNDNPAVITSLTIQSGSGRSAIKEGSIFTLYGT